MLEADIINALALVAGIAFLFLAIFIGLYIYIALTTMALAKKTHTKLSWLAWIPLANFYLYSQIAHMHWWPIFLLVGIFIPYLQIPALIAFTIFNIIWFWKIFESVGKPGWWILLSIIPVAGWIIVLVFLGLAAWSKDKNEIKNSLPIISPQRIIARSKLPEQKTTSPRLDRVKKLKSSLR